MKLELSAEQKAFQAEVREFLNNTLPEDISGRVLNGLPPLRDDFVRWQGLLYEKGWIAPNWPTEYGGTGWTAIQRHIWETECARAGALPVNPFNFKMLGPVIYTFGSEQQKQKFLPDILAGNVFFCQGYSEPNAGSDLASLKTTAVCDGDSYLVNGTKTWTTYGHYADWIFCLVRTAGPEVKNQEAISFLLISLNSPGVTVSPIITLDGRREVNEIHFENVRVPAENLIGDEGKGWTYAKYLLTHERTNTALVGTSRQRLDDVETRACQTGDHGEALMDDPAFAGRFAEVEIELLALEYTELRTLSATQTGQAPGPESSILKYLGTLITQAIDRAALAACSEAVGAMEAALWKTVAYTQQRKQFGVPIATFQALRHRMAEMYIECEQARSITLMANLTMDANADDSAKAVSAAKYRVGRAARLVGEEAVQMHGAIGVTDEADIGHYLKRLTAIQYSFGSGDCHKQRYIDLSSRVA